MKRKQVPHVEFNWGEAEPFALVTTTTTDGDRVAAERAQQTKDRQEADKQQLELQ